MRQLIADFFGSLAPAAFDRQDEPRAGGTGLSPPSAGCGLQFDQELGSITRSCDSRPVPIPAPAPGLHYRQRWLPGLKRGHGSLRMAGQHSTSRSRSENKRTERPAFHSARLATGRSAPWSPFCPFCPFRPFQSLSVPFSPFQSLSVPFSPFQSLLSLQSFAALRRCVNRGQFEHYFLEQIVVLAAVQGRLARPQFFQSLLELIPLLSFVW
jgi:hypothetical protein